MKDQGQEAGDNSEQYLAGRDIVIVQTGITYTEAQAIALEVFENNSPRLTHRAEAVIEDRMHALNDQIVERIYARNPSDLDRFGDPRILAALVSAQRSFAETGRKDLGDVLCGLVADLAAEPESTRREIILRSAVDCAPRLTRAHFNALCAIFFLRQHLHVLAHFEPLPERLDAEFRPYYGDIPSAAFDYSYMGSTEAGRFYGGLGGSLFKRIHERYANVMYEPFTYVELPDGLFDDVPEDEQGPLLNVIPEDAEKAKSEDTRYRLTYEASLEILSDSLEVFAKLKGVRKQLREFLKPRMMTQGDLRARIEAEQPELFEFFSELERTRAMDFELSPTGIMLARQHIFSRDPDDAAKIDQLFEF